MGRIGDIEIEGMSYSLVILEGRQFLDGVERRVIVDHGLREIIVASAFSHEEQLLALGRTLSDWLSRRSSGHRVPVLGSVD